jgi:hypothetical protein
MAINLELIMEQNNEIEHLLGLEGIEELDEKELVNIKGGWVIFLAAFAIGWQIAHHQAVNEGRCR